MTCEKWKVGYQHDPLSSFAIVSVSSTTFYHPCKSPPSRCAISTPIPKLSLLFWPLICFQITIALMLFEILQRNVKIRD